MTDLNETFKQIEAHAREWLEFSRETYGWNSREYGDYVRCYFADASDHRTVRIGKYGRQVEVQFHSPVQFGGLTQSALANIDNILANSRELLTEERRLVAERTEAEVQAERSKQIEALRLRLAELEGGVAAPGVAA